MGGTGAAALLPSPTAGCAPASHGKRAEFINLLTNNAIAKLRYNKRGENASILGENASILSKNAIPDEPGLFKARHHARGQ